MGETLAGGLKDIAAGLTFLNIHRQAQVLKTLAYVLGGAGIDDEDDLNKVIRDAEAYREQQTSKRGEE